VEHISDDKLSCRLTTNVVLKTLFTEFWSFFIKSLDFLLQI